VTGEQLQWLEQTLADNPGVTHIVAVGHAPVLAPAPEGPGSLALEGGRQSALWQALGKKGADLYLCGAAHAAACTQADGILQIAHGGLWQSQEGRASINYLVATVYPDRIDLEVKEIAIVPEGDRLPQSADTPVSEKIRIPDEAKQKGFTTVGTAVLHRDGTGLKLSRATGCFEKTE
jgi:hypothetical protein